MAARGRSISVLIPALNAGRAFGTVLHRIMGQGCAPLEILVLDGGSRDGTRHIVAQFPAARVLEVSPAGGAPAWNRGVGARLARPPSFRVPAGAFPPRFTRRTGECDA